MTASTTRALVTLCITLFSVACDEEKKVPAKPTETAAPPPKTAAIPSASTPAASAASGPSMMVSMDDSSVYVAGTRVDLGGPDPIGRVRTELSQKDVASASISFEVGRQAKAPKVAAVFSLLRAAKAKGLLIHTPDRTGKMTEVAVTFQAPPAQCSPAAWIAKDMSTSTWSGLGGNVHRASKGMAGPDITIASDAIRKLPACESDTLVVSGEDTVGFGLLLDLYLAVSSKDVSSKDKEASPSKIRSLWVSDTAAPGKKLVF
jgi:hypothetical protein